jgi:hypothetical protein
MLRCCSNARVLNIQDLPISWSKWHHTTVPAQNTIGIDMRQTRTLPQHGVDHFPIWVTYTQLVCIHDWYLSNMYYRHNYYRKHIHTPRQVPYLYLNVHVMPVSKSSMETNTPSFSVRHGKWASASFYTTKTSCQNENKIYEIAERTPITCWKETLTKNEKPYMQILNHHNGQTAAKKKKSLTLGKMMRPRFPTSLGRKSFCNKRSRESVFHTCPHK